MTLTRRVQVRHIIKAVNGRYHPRCQQQAREPRRLAKIRKAREEAHGE